MSSEREETLVEQLKLRDQRILELQGALRDCAKILEEVAKSGEAVLALWNKQQERLAILEAAVRGPHFPNTAK